MKKLLCVLCMALSLVACDKKNDNPQNKPVVKIGASLPLTGNMASIGNAAHKALLAAVRDENANPANKYYYKLIVEDDQMEPKFINNSVNKLIHSDKVDVIVSYFTAAGRIIAPMATKNKTLNFNYSFDGGILQSKYNFQNILTVDDIDTKAIKFFKSRKIKNIDLLFQNMGAADQMLNPLLVMLKDNGIKYTIHRFNKGETDFKILVSKLKNSKSDAVYIYGVEPEVDILAREFRLQNLNKLIGYSDILPMIDDYTLFEGYYNIGSFVTPESYKEAWGLKGQNAGYSGYIYDTGRIIVEGYENAPATGIIPTPDEVSDYLHSRTDYSGIVGKYKLDKHGQFHSGGYTTVVKDGKHQEIKE